MQETFPKVYEQIQGFDERKQFSSWVYRIAHNLGINYLKKRRRMVKIDADALAQVPKYAYQGFFQIGLLLIDAFSAADV